jgi:hypothetical protein
MHGFCQLGEKLSLKLATAALIIGCSGLAVGLTMLILSGVSIVLFDMERDALLVLIGTLILITSGILLYMNHIGIALQHPLFRRGCYKEAEQSHSPSGSRQLQYDPSTYPNTLTDDKISDDLEWGVYRWELFRRGDWLLRIRR